MRSSRRSRSSAAAILLAAAAAAAGAILALLPAGADPGTEVRAGEPRPSGLVEKAEVRLALLEIVVLDSRGRHVRDLPRSAFHVLEKGRDLPVRSLDEIDLVKRAPAPAPPPMPAGDAAPPGAPAAAPAPPPPAGEGAASVAERRRSRPRWFLLLFDGYNNPSPLRINQLRKAAKKWLGENLRSQDFAAVYEMTPFLSSVSGFTQDVVDLRIAIDKVRVFPASDLRDEAIRRVLASGSSATSDDSRTMFEQQVRNAAQFGGDLLSREQDQFYLSLSDAAGSLAGLDGTKAILLFSGGFPVTRTRTTAARGGLTPRFKDMLARLERAGIRVFTFDVGEDGGFSDTDTAQNLSLALDELELGQEWLEQLGVGGEVNAQNAHQEILAVLGNETGGRFLRGRDYELGLDAAADDLSHYYILGYEPPPPDPKGRSYVPVRVKADGKGIRVVARQGRFVEEKLAHSAAAAAVSAAAADAAEAERRDRAASEAMAASALAISCRPLFYPHPDGRTLVVLPVEIAGPVPAVPASGGALDLDLDLVVSADLAEGDVRTSRRNVRARLKPEARQALERGMQLRDAIVLPAGAAGISVSVRLNGLDRSGQWAATLPVPARDGTRFGLTEIATLAPGHAIPVVFDVFAKRENVTGTVPSAPVADPLGADARGRPPAYVTGSLASAEPLLAQVGVTAAPRAGSSGESPLRLDWELLPASGGSPVAPPVRYRRLEMRDDGMLDVVAEIALSGLDAGEWVLRLTAENLATREKDSRSAPLRIAP